MLDLARGDKVANGSGDIFDRNVRINAVLVEQIDRVDAEPPKRAFDCLADLPRLTIHPTPILTGGRIDVETELGGDHHSLAEWPQRLADHFLVRERPVDLRGVEKGHAALDGAADQRNALILRQLVGIAETDAHAAKAHGRNVQAAAAELSSLHRSTSQECPNDDALDLRIVPTAAGARTKRGAASRQLPHHSHPSRLTRY